MTDADKKVPTPSFHIENADQISVHGNSVSDAARPAARINNASRIEIANNRFGDSPRNIGGPIGPQVTLPRAKTATRKAKAGPVMRFLQREKEKRGLLWVVVGTVAAIAATFFAQ